MSCVTSSTSSSSPGNYHIIQKTPLLSVRAHSSVKIMQTVLNCIFLVLYARDALLMSTFALVLTVLLRGLTNSSTPGPVWISTVVDTIVKSTPGQAILYNYSVIVSEYFDKPLDYARRRYMKHRYMVQEDFNQVVRFKL